MIFFILICTFIGWLCGAPLIGLGVGVALFALGVWVDSPMSLYQSRRRRKRVRR